VADFLRTYAFHKSKKFHDQLSNYQHLKEDPIPWSYGSRFIGYLSALYQLQQLLSVE
jgi:hypothetical protein